MVEENKFDVIIIGGSYAGLSAAMSLGRSLRKVLIIDNTDPCNKQTPHSHNFITQDGSTPAEIASKAKEQVLKYPTVTFRQDTVLAIHKTDHGFSVQSQHHQFTARYIVLATGLKDNMANIAGYADCWGISVIHCPYCHGYEVRHQKTGILANGDIAFHYAKLVSNLTKDLVIFTNGKAQFTDEQYDKLKHYNIEIIEKNITSIQHKKGQIQQLLFEDNTIYSLDVLYSSFGFTQKSDLVGKLALEMTEKGLIKVDAMQKTSIDGIFACGDNSNPLRTVAMSVSAGSMAGMALNFRMVEEAF